MAAEKDARQRVIVFGGNGIEFVVVAAGAGDGQAEKTARDHVDLVIDHVREHFFFVSLALFPAADGQHGRGNDAFGIDAARHGGGEQVSSDLHDDELVEGEVPIK